jgi:hypothetical protein
MSSFPPSHLQSFKPTTPHDARDDEHIELRAPVNTRTDTLGSDFARGWHKLPNELKTTILAFNLVCHPVIIHRSALGDPGDVSSYGHQLRSTPEIAQLAREIYYTKNTFRLKKIVRKEHTGHGRRTRIHCFAYPTHCPNVLIRSLEIHCGLVQSYCTHLRRLARSDYDFQNLCSIKIEVFGKPRSGLSLIPDGRADPFRFACDGTVVSYTDRFRTSPKILQECLEKIFKFGCSKDKRGMVADTESENASETATSLQQEPRASRDNEA